MLINILPIVSRMGKVVHFWDKCALAAREPTIHRMKGDVHGFYMTHKNLIWSKRLQSYLSHKLLLPVGLVQYYFFYKNLLVSGALGKPIKSDPSLNVSH